MTGPRDDDGDRAAILARRQRFIAIALSGLASAGTTCTAPQPCLNISQPQGSGGAPEPVSQPADGTATPAGTPDAPPQACLKVAPVVKDVPPGDTATPRPCLEVVPPPEPPDDKAAPRPCLKVSAPDPTPTPSPTPCLRIAKPTRSPAEPK